MSWTSFELTVVTPLFSGDDPDSGRVDSPVRVPSIRGVLRFWLRALAAGHQILDRQGLWQQEQAVFGSTERPSPIALRISGQPRAVRTAKPDWVLYPRPAPGEKDGFHGAQYLLGQGLWSYRDGITRPFVEPQRTVTLGVRFTDDESVNNLFMLALWAWLTYGGLGARTRRGFGQLRCTDVTGTLPTGWDAADLVSPNRRGAWVELGAKVLPETLVRRKPKGWRSLLTADPADGEPLPEVPALCPKWWAGETFADAGSLGEALHLAGRELRLFRAADSTGRSPSQRTRSPEWVNVVHGTDKHYPVAALGLPVGYSSRDRAGNQIKATVDVHADKPLRRASPVWIRPVALGSGQWTVFTHVFWAALLPLNATITLSGPGHGQSKCLHAPNRQALDTAWDAWLALHRGQASYHHRI